MNIEDSRSIERLDSSALKVRSAVQPPGDKRKPIKHILIGAPEIVSFTTRRSNSLAMLKPLIGHVRSI